MNILSVKRPSTGSAKILVHHQLLQCWGEVKNAKVNNCIKYK